MNALPLSLNIRARVAPVILVLIVNFLRGAAISEAATHSVSFNNFSFVPPVLSINVGDTVVWTNEGGFHTVTGLGADPFCGPDAVPVSCSVTFTNAGTFAYQCNFHVAQGMVGTINVSQASNAPPFLSILSPTNNTVFATPTSVTVTATNQSGTTLTNVEFFDNGRSAGKVASSPFSTDLNLGAGVHVITARGTDTEGNSSTSDPVMVTVKNEIEDPISQKIVEGGYSVELETVLDGLVSPLGLAAPDDGSGRLFIYDQVGMIYVLTQGTNSVSTMLDIRSRLVTLRTNYDERGLLGVAAHPNFAQHPLIYTYTSEPSTGTADFPVVKPEGKTNDHQSVIAEWKLTEGGTNTVDVTTRREILRIDKPQANHNGGVLRFGPDGFLYFSLGDGGGADDQGDGHSEGGNAQDKTKILGKIVRIDVDGRTSSNSQYSVPPDNPFVGQSNVVSEIFAFGFRNPFSFSFDKQNGNLWVGDVGQNQIEEVDQVTKGANYGWPFKEGGFFFNANGTNNGYVTQTPPANLPTDLVDPIAQFDHDEGESVIGGYVYRGSSITNLQGKYITGDLGTDETGVGRLLVLITTNQLQEIRIGADDRGLGVYLKGFGEDREGELYIFGSSNVGPGGTGGKMFKIVPSSSASPDNRFVQHNLVSDLAGQADLVDTNLVNPWGLASGPTSPFWVADNHAGVSTLYDTVGAIQPLVVTIPPAPGSEPPGAPTGVVYNETPDFAVGGQPAKFIFVSEDGTISAWNTGASAEVKVNNSTSEAIYKGVAIGANGSSNLLFAANFYAGTIETFDGSFAALNLTNAFKDPTLPAGYAPFNIQNLKGELYVTYAKQDDDKEDDVPGHGNGFVNVFDTGGILVKRLITQGALDAPWGLAIAPTNFGPFGSSLLVGNFGNGAINAFNPTNGTFLGALLKDNGDPLRIEGLWGIMFGNGGMGGDLKTLYFAAGPGDESHGLFGSVSASVGLRLGPVTIEQGKLKLTWTGGVGPYLIQMKMNITDANWTDVRTVSESSALVDIAGISGFFHVVDQSAVGLSR